MKIVVALTALLFSSPLVAFAATPPQSPAQKSAIAAMVSWGRSHGETDIEQATCNVIEGWARCGYGSGGGEAYTNVIMRTKNGAWKVVAHGGGAMNAGDFESLGMPTAIAERFAPPPPSVASACPASASCAALLPAMKQYEADPHASWANTTVKMNGPYAALYDVSTTAFVGIYHLTSGKWTKLRCSWGNYSGPLPSDEFQAAVRSCRIPSHTASSLAP
jgi:hypothetical protein